MCVDLPSTQRHKIPHSVFIYTDSHLAQMFSHLCIMLPIMMYYVTLSYWCTHDVKVTVIFISVWHWLESTAKEKIYISHVRCRHIFLSISLSDPTPVFFQLCAYQNSMGTGNYGKYQYIFGAIILWKIIMMLSTWCLYLVPFLVIKIHLKPMIVLFIVLYFMLIYDFWFWSINFSGRGLQ